MKRFIEGVERTQSSSFPALLDEYITEENGVRVIDVFIDSLHLKALGFDGATPANTGRPSYHPAVLLKMYRKLPHIRDKRQVELSGRFWLEVHNLQASMSRRGSCHDNVVAESFFQLLKREQLRRRVYNTREETRQDVFDYIEMFYNPKRRHGYTNWLSPVDYERQFFERLASV